jgi:drug/metabolite transporter (DMT)-like permease
VRPDARPDARVASLGTATEPAPVTTVGDPAPVTLHRVSGRRGLGLALTLTTVGLWSILPLGLRIALGGMDAVTLTWYRFVAAALVMGAVLAATGGLPRLRTFDRRRWELVVVAIVFLCGNYVLYVLGLERTNAGTAQVVIQLAPLLLAVGGVWVYGERLGLAQWLGFASMLAGFVLFSHEQIAHLAGALDRYLAGLAAIVVAAMSWAVYGLAQKQLLHTMRSGEILLCLYVGGALLFAPFANPAQLATMTGTQLGALAFCTANMLVAYGTFAEALDHLEASRVSAVLAIVPLTTLLAIRAAQALAPSLVGPEPLTWVGVVGAALVVIGSLAAVLGRREALDP